MLKVQIRNDLSFSDLVNLQSSGKSVIKTPHVGNVYLNNLLVADLGIKMLFYDRTLGYKDFNFHPHRVVRAKEDPIDIASPEILTTHNVVNCRKDLGFISGLCQDMSIVDFHMNSLQTVIPDIDAITYTDYLQEHKSLVMKILKMLNQDPRILSEWNRYVDTFGILQQRSPGSWLDVEPFIFGLTNSQFGWLIPNSITILLSGIIEAVVTGCNEVFHLSGPDMVRYINMHKRFFMLAQSVVDASDIPVDIIFNLIPVAENRLVVPSSYKESLDNLIDAYINIKSAEISRGALAKKVTDSTERSALFDNFKKQRAKEREALQIAISECTVIFYDIRSARYFSQYDMLAGESLYYHPWTIEAPLEDISKAMKLFNAIYNNH